MRVHNDLEDTSMVLSTSIVGSQRDLSIVLMLKCDFRSYSTGMG